MTLIDLAIAVTVHELAQLAVRDGRPDDAVALLERELDILARDRVEEIASARLLLADTLWARAESRARAIDLARAARDHLRDAGKDAAAAQTWLGEHGMR